MPPARCRKKLSPETETIFQKAGGPKFLKTLRLDTAETLVRHWPKAGVIT